MPTPLIRFPRDEGIHPHGMEWWYWNGNLKDRSGKAHAFMLTLFKFTPIRLKTVWFLHSLVASDAGPVFEPRFDVFTGGLDCGSFVGHRLRARVRGKLVMQKTGAASYALRSPQMSLTMRAVKPPILIGGGLVNLKTSKTYYYSFPRLACRGSIIVGARRVPVTGLAWMDHQWNPITFHRENAWRWFSFHLSDGTDVQCFDFGKRRRTRIATVSNPDGSSATTTRITFTPRGPRWKSPHTGASYPLRWRIRIPGLKISLECSPRITDGEMRFGAVNYWEGPMSARGTRNGKKIEGDGFMELVGFRRTKALARILLGEAEDKLKQEFPGVRVPEIVKRLFRV